MQYGKNSMCEAAPSSFIFEIIDFFISSRSYSNYVLFSHLTKVRLRRDDSVCSYGIRLQLINLRLLGGSAPQIPGVPEGGVLLGFIKKYVSSSIVSEKFYKVE